LPTSTPSQPAVVLENVTKLFGRFAALREVSAGFSAGKLCAIFGENGAGKSTLLRVIAGLAQPTQGSVTITGAADRETAARRLGYMAHASLLYDELSALENLRYVAALYGVRDEKVCSDVITWVGLDPALGRAVGHYSQGMRQRLSLARALLHGPSLLLLDEPFSNLDPASAQSIAKELGRMRDAGRTLLVVTHQAVHLEGIADESIWISAGRIARREPGVGAARGAQA
jgi:heme ABC exporter ATP-binding subunit CcmA